MLPAASRGVPTRALPAGSPIHAVLAFERYPSELVPPQVPLHPVFLQSKLCSLFSNLGREFGASSVPVRSLNPAVMLSPNTGTPFANLARPARAAVRDALPALGSWKRGRCSSGFARAPGCPAAASPAAFGGRRWCPGDLCADVGGSLMAHLQPGSASLPQHLPGLPSSAGKSWRWNTRKSPASSSHLPRSVILLNQGKLSHVKT